MPEIYEVDRKPRQRQAYSSAKVVSVEKRLNLGSLLTMKCRLIIFGDLLFIMVTNSLSRVGVISFDHLV